jgi:hypothetical protein
LSRKLENINENKKNGDPSESLNKEIFLTEELEKNLKLKKSNKLTFNYFKFQYESKNDLNFDNLNLVELKQKNFFNGNNKILPGLNEIILNNDKN